MWNVAFCRLAFMRAEPSGNYGAGFLRNWVAGSTTSKVASICFTSGRSCASLSAWMTLTTRNAQPSFTKAHWRQAQAVPSRKARNVGACCMAGLRRVGLSRRQQHSTVVVASPLHAALRDARAGELKVVS